MSRRIALQLGLICLVAVGAMRGVALAADQGPANASGDAQAELILGNWLTARRNGIIQISRSPDGHYQGRIVGGDEPERVDANNPDPTRRTQRLFGQTILRDMNYDGQGRWSGGTIYDPDSGHTYRCRIELRGHDQLRIRGFLGVSLIGRSQIWTRYLGTSMLLPQPGR
jgi:uncharacterized protein (DUF2147 family)